MKPSTDHPVIVEHLTKRYGDHTVVDDLSFTVEPGRVTGFLGPNGSGKSTTMKVMLDLAGADGGRATIGGQRYRDLAEPAHTIGAMIESDAFHPGRSGRNHLRILADALGIPIRRVDTVLEEVGLTDAARRNAGGYSLGMRQRLGLAAALLGEPPVLILDEPGNGLDPEGIRTLRDRLRAQAADGGTVFVSSHLLDEVEHLADDVIVINTGRLVAQGSLAELQQAAVLVRSSDACRLAAMLDQADAFTEAHGPDSLVVRDMPIDEIGDRAFAAGVAIHEPSPRAPGLAGIPDLAAELSRTGADVSFTMGPVPADLSAAVDLSAYRVVQESLTNVIKHAGPHPTVHLRVGLDDSGLVIDVDNTITPSHRHEAVSELPASGYGIAGMRERAALLGGTLTAGHRSPDRFSVTVRIPLDRDTT